MESSDLKSFLQTEGMVIPIDKPLGWTSFDVVNKVRIYIKYRLGLPGVKAGHAGTLDPLATGLLLLCLGKATRSINTLQDLPKTYTGTIRLGESTPSFDAETPVCQTAPTAHITPEMISQAALALTGDLMQEPPLFSAIKTGGKRAYRMARNNEDVVLPKRPVTVYAFKTGRLENNDLPFEIQCSKGTYIRALARDLGLGLGSCAYLTSLRRTAIGDYTTETAFTIESLDAAFSEFLSQDQL